jgi:hypothetical protein
VDGWARGPVQDDKDEEKQDAGKDMTVTTRSLSLP